MRSVLLPWANGFFPHGLLRWIGCVRTAPLLSSRTPPLCIAHQPCRAAPIAWRGRLSGAHFSLMLGETVGLAFGHTGIRAS